MLLGEGGVGKSSFVLGLKNLPLPAKANSTQVAEIHTLMRERETSSHVARGKFRGDHLTDVTEEDEMKELAGLVKHVYKDKHIISPQSPRLIHGKGSALSAGGGSTFSRKILTVINDLMDYALKAPKVQAVPESEIYLYIWDCGGQSIFLSVLQAFLTAKSFFILMFNAQHDLLLNRYLSLSYHDGVATEVYEEINTQELLIKWMACIDATIGDKSLACILPIGTHGDDPTVKKHKNAILKQLYEEYKDKNFARLIPNQGFIVDNTTAGKGDTADPVYKQVLQMIYKFASNDAIKVDTPISWVLFRKVMKVLAKGESKPCFTKGEVEEVAEACKIPKSSVPSVLKFYHELGVFLHYSNIPSLQSTIIADPHWLVKQMAKLLALRGFEERGYPALWERLHKEGILVKELYTDIWRGTKLSPQAILDLLNHFLIIAPIKTQDNGSYFVPSVLPPLPSEPRSSDTAMIKATSLHIIFPEVKYLPPGFFTRLAVVISQEDGYTIAFGRGIYRNQISYILGQSGVENHSLTLSERKYSLEITLACHYPRGYGHPFFWNVCLRAYQTIEKCCWEVHQRLPHITFGFGFCCDECGTDNPEHFVVLKSDYTTKSSTHCKHGKMHKWRPEQKYWLQVEKFPKSGEPLLPTEIKIINEELKWEIEDLKKALEMTTEEYEDPKELIECWSEEMEEMKEAPRPYLVHHLESMGMQELARKVRRGTLTHITLSSPQLASFTSSEDSARRAKSLLGADQFEALEKLRKHRVLLEKVMTLDLTFLAHEMNAVGLLPDYTHKDVTDPRSMLTKAQKATSMMSSLEIKVEINQHNLDKFVRILENKPQLFGDIINYLSPPGQDSPTSPAVKQMDTTAISNESKLPPVAAAAAADTADLRVNSEPETASCIYCCFR